MPLSSIKPLSRLGIALALFVLLVLGAIFALSFRSSPPTAAEEPPPVRSSYASVTQFVPGPLERLHSADTDGRIDVSALQATLTGLAQSLQGSLPPIGDDRDLARALLGRNRDGLAFLPPDSPAYDSVTGHLKDRWGTPYFVHPRGPRDFEIRSAGADRKLFTADDLVSSKGPYFPQASMRMPPPGA
jgi:hypothetical protein